MARNFTAANEEYFEKDVAPVTAAPLSVSCWFRSTDVDATQTLLMIVDKETENQFFRLNAHGSGAGDRVRWIANAGSGSAIANTSTGYSANTWHHALGVETSTTSRHVLIDAGSKGTNTQTRAPVAVDRISIGRSGDAVPGGYFSGRIAEVAVWDAALSDNEATALSRGVPAFFIRPANLQGYWPLWGIHSPEIDLSANSNSLTENNTVPAADHAPVAPLISAWWEPGQPSGIPASLTTSDNDKLALIHYNQPFQTPATIATTTFSQGDKQQLIWQYPGIEWAAQLIVEEGLQSASRISHLHSMSREQILESASRVAHLHSDSLN